MYDYVPDLLKFGAGVATGWTAHLFAGRRDAKNRIRRAKDEFLAGVAAQRAELNSLARQDYKHFNPNEDVVFKQSIETMTAAVYRVRPYLSAKENACLTEVLTDYQGHEETYTGLTRRSLDEKSGFSFVQRLQGYMQRFAECIDK